MAGSVEVNPISCMKVSTIFKHVVNKTSVRSVNGMVSAVAFLSWGGYQVMKLLLKKMSLSMGSYDLRVVRDAFDILLDDSELRPSDVSDVGGKRLAAKRISQMTMQEIANLGPTEAEDSEEKEIESSDGETNMEGATLASGDADFQVQDEDISQAF